MNNQTKSKAIEWLKKEYPRGVDLVYIDYTDRLEDAKQREELLQDPDNSWKIVNGGTEWITDATYEGVREVVGEYMRNNDTTTEEDKEEIEAWCWDHDTSDPVRDILKNTGSEYLYYDTGLEVPEYQDNQEAMNTAKAIANKLCVDYEKHKSDLDLLVSQASYGGQLVILFTGSIADFMEEAKYIHFKGNASVCIMDRGNGSGDNTELGEEMTFTFDRRNLHSDEGDNGYSYTGDVCGLISGLYEDGELTNKKRAGTIKVETNEDADTKREKEKQYIANWKAGKCTAGDMNIKRHANAPYRNDYPCGNKCEVCGTFWID